MRWYEQKRNRMEKKSPFLYKEGWWNIARNWGPMGQGMYTPSTRKTAAGFNSFVCLLVRLDHLWRRAVSSGTYEVVVLPFLEEPSQIGPVSNSDEIDSVRQVSRNQSPQGKSSIR